MRALFVIPGRQLDGAARALVEGGVALAAGDDFPMVATAPGGDVERMAHQCALETLSMAPHQNVVGRAAALRALVTKHFVDVIYVSTEAELLAAAIAARWSRRGVVVQRLGAGPTPARTWRSRLARRLARTGFLVTSPPPAATEPTHDATTDAPLGVRLPDAAADVGRETDEPILTCISGDRETERRALGEVLRVFALLRDRFPRLRLSVVGNRDETAETKARLHAAALGVANDVDWIPDPLLRQAALGRSTLGYVAADGDDGVYGWLDFMAHGVPFVARRTPLAERYVANGIHGVLLPTLDPARAASELAVMLSSPERREAIGAASRTRVARDFNDRTAAQPFTQIVRRLRGQTS